MSFRFENSFIFNKAMDKFLIHWSMLNWLLLLLWDLEFVLCALLMHITPLLNCVFLYQVMACILLVSSEQFYSFVPEGVEDNDPANYYHD